MSVKTDPDFAPKLSVLQGWIQQAITGRASPAKLERTLSLIRSPQSNLKNGLRVEERLAIYSGAWFLRLEESLREDYPALASSLDSIDADAWETLARGYVRACPSRSFTLAQMGDGLPEYLSRWESPASRPWHSELARLERACYQNISAPDPAPWNLDLLRGMDLEQASALRLSLQPSAKLLGFHWNVEKFWRERHSDAVLPGTWGLLVHRRGESTQVETLSTAEFHFLQQVEAGVSLGELTESEPGGGWLAFLQERATHGVIRPLII